METTIPPQPANPETAVTEEAPQEVVAGTEEMNMASEFMARNWRGLIRPRTLDIVEKAETYGKFSCEPLERGYGTTLGNSCYTVGPGIAFQTEFLICSIISSSISVSNSYWLLSY